MLFITSVLISKIPSFFKNQPLIYKPNPRGLNNKNLNPIALIATNETLKLTLVILFIVPWPSIALAP
jgi:hypothetical protein